MKKKIYYFLLQTILLVLLLITIIFTDYSYHKERQRYDDTIVKLQNEIETKDAMLDNNSQQYDDLSNKYNNLLSDYNILVNEYNELNKNNNELQIELDRINNLTFEDEVSMIPYEISVDYLNKYKELLAKYKMSNDIRDYFTDDEIYLMQRCIETEVFGGKFDCKVHVASAIMNRLSHNGFPNNVTEVITTPRQFAYFRTNITESTKLALEYAILVGDTVNGCFSFRSDIKPMEWYGWKYQFSDEVHNFYK